MVWFLKSKSLPTSVDRVVVTRSAYNGADADPAALVEAIVKFVNVMYEQGAWRADEMPVEAQLVYSSDYYLAQVNNGGHAQFIWNGRAHLEKNCAAAIMAFKAMQSPGHLAIMNDLQDWLKTEGDQAFEQTGLVGNGKRAPFLEALDDRFFAQQRTVPMTPLSATWIKTWRNLTVVEDSAYPAEIAKLAARNPKRANRKAVQALFPIISRTTTHLEVGFGLAVSHLPTPSILMSIQPGRFTNFGGESVPVFRLVTTAGEFLGVPYSLGAIVYPFEQSGQPKDPNKPLRFVENQMIDSVVKLSTTTNAGVAIGFLLKDQFGDPAYTALGAKHIVTDRPEPYTVWQLAAKGRTLEVLVAHSGAVLSDEHGKTLKQISATALAERLNALSS